MRRFKTKQEFIDQYGENWHEEIQYRWETKTGVMDPLFGIPFKGNIDERVAVPGTKWTAMVSDDMITDKPLPDSSNIEERLVSIESTIIELKKIVGNLIDTKQLEKVENSLNTSINTLSDDMESMDRDLKKYRKKQIETLESRTNNSITEINGKLFKIESEVKNLAQNKKSSLKHML